MDNSNSLPLGSAAVPAKERTTSSRIKSIFSGSVGNMVEWYDWYVYAAFSLYFAKTFFPAGSGSPRPNTCRSATFANSRTLPGQSWLSLSLIHI